MTVTNPDKVMFPEPGHTKADLVGHYRDVADRMLPWIRGRPLSLERYPNGVGEKGFMQKNASKHFSGAIGRVEVAKSDGTVTHPIVDDADGLAELANQGTIAFHVWTARVPDLDEPTHLVIDLDPSEGAIDLVRPAAVASRDVLSRFGLANQLVASGRKGFHLWVPIDPVPYETAGDLARALAGLVAAEHPDVATTEFRKNERGNRVFIDWLRNRRAQSIVCPWSLRVTPSATVATPISWDEFENTPSDRFTLETVGDRADLTPPEPATLPVDDIVEAARSAGVDLDTDFDRFGRR